MNDRISIVTICFNSEMEIENTLESVLKQDYKSIEYIIKDGDSADKTNEIIKAYQAEFQDRGIEFRHIISKDRGIYDAMNIAVENCHGDWVLFMNSGDRFYNNTVISDIFDHKDWHDADAVYGHTLFLLSKNRGMIANHHADYLEDRWSMCHQSLFVRREWLQKFPFDCQYRIAADYDQMLKLKKEGCIFKRVNVIIAIMDREGVSIQRIALRSKENNLLRDKYNLEWKKKSVAMGYIKQFIRKIMPSVEIFSFVRAYMKCIIQFESYDR